MVMSSAGATEVVRPRTIRRVQNMRMVNRNPSSGCVETGFQMVAPGIKNSRDRLTALPAISGPTAPLRSRLCNARNLLSDQPGLRPGQKRQEQAPFLAHFSPRRGLMVNKRVNVKFRGLAPGAGQNMLYFRSRDAIPGPSSAGFPVHFFSLRRAASFGRGPVTSGDEVSAGSGGSPRRPLANARGSVDSARCRAATVKGAGRAGVSDFATSLFASETLLGIRRSKPRRRPLAATVWKGFPARLQVAAREKPVRFHWLHKRFVAREGCLFLPDGG